ncbi:MAG: glucokinase [Methyloprofundus sp.]|nr:MAG: glucokinase [Methyloprofundus sp.]
MILAGDIGGTKTVLALYKKNSQGELHCELEQSFPSADYAQFDEILAAFLQTDMQIEAACFGIAGPIIEQCCQTTNLPWSINAQELMQTLGTDKVKLLNDLAAMSLGMLHSAEDDLLELNPNAVTQNGNIAVLAAGTGLGQAILYWDGQQHHPIATEGGHCDFAAQTQQQDQFLNYLRQLFPEHVSWERVLSGDGFGYIYDFLVASGFAAPCSVVPAVNEAGVDRNAIISNLGIDNKDPLCVEVVRLFVELYAAETGNLALKCLASGGIFIGGGIAPKICSAMENGDFLKHFLSKGRFNPLLSKISIKISLNPNTPLIGAANYFA